MIRDNRFPRKESFSTLFFSCYVTILQHLFLSASHAPAKQKQQQIDTSKTQTTKIASSLKKNLKFSIRILASKIAHFATCSNIHHQSRGKNHKLHSKIPPHFITVHSFVCSVIKQNQNDTLGKKCARNANLCENELLYKSREKLNSTQTKVLQISQTNTHTHTHLKKTISLLKT